MLVLKRKDGEWVEIVHRSGDVLRVRVYGVQAGLPGRVNVAFDDAPRHFEIRRPERKQAAPRPAAEMPPVVADAVVAIDPAPEAGAAV